MRKTLEDKKRQLSHHNFGGRSSVSVRMASAPSFDLKWNGGKMKET